MDFVLPDELTDGAILRDKEYAWDLSAFPRALERAPGLGYACLGGQPWFLLPDNTLYEPFWLEADSTDRAPTETWPEDAQRSCVEVLSKFNSLVHSTNFAEEAKKFGTFESIGVDELNLKIRTLFNAYFVTEQGLRSLKKKGTE
jgi:hypothetical protein